MRSPVSSQLQQRLVPRQVTSQVGQYHIQRANLA
jgi:hypothetical protein